MRLRTFALPLIAAATVLAVNLAVVPACFGQELPSVDEKTEGFSARPGFVPVFFDADLGKTYLQIDRLDEDFLYVSSLPGGLGSNDIGLDRGLLGDRRVVRFEKVGRKILLTSPNLRFRAMSDDAMERKAVEDAFATSILWSFEIVAATGNSYLVDATDFVVHDAMGIANDLRQSGQGSFSLDAKRSVPVPDMIKAFPKNTELESRLTFTSNEPGRFVREVATNPNAITLRIRQSLIELPDLEGYTPREFDPRSGFFSTSFVDYAVPVGEETVVRYIARHRLHEQDQQPIVYYVDSGTPEPIRSALVEGARWWADAFEAAGFEDAFRVEVLPEGADPMDIRYNVINWVHRSTRGWSYGSSVTDPRTGEILKGHVSLGSLRIRQDYLIAEGLLAPYVDTDTPVPDDDPMLQLALARIRQLSAHEVGHTLGLAHNFAASVTGQASVMDYPAPLADVTFDGRITIDSAYTTGVGAWDKLAIRYGYSEFRNAAAEEAGLQQILDEAEAAGLLYITDSDARPAGSAHPLAHLWDNDATALAGLERDMDVRQAALASFGLNAIRFGRPVASLEEVLVPLYLRHRYQSEAVSKVLGGVNYAYTVREAGENPQPPTPVDGRTQRAALAALLETVAPEFLALPVEIRNMIPPRPPGYGGSRELFPGHTGITFDAYAPAGVAARMIFDLILNPERAARLAYQPLGDPDLPGLGEVLETVTQAVWKSGTSIEPYEAEVQRTIQDNWVKALMELAASSDAAPAVLAAVDAHLRALHAFLESNIEGLDERTINHRVYIENELQRFLFRQYEPDQQPETLPLPPGSPIGTGGDHE